MIRNIRIRKTVETTSTNNNQKQTIRSFGQVTNKAPYQLANKWYNKRISRKRQDGVQEVLDQEENNLKNPNPTQLDFSACHRQEAFLPPAP
ncbi:hypothetical protein PoB_002453100 [Plakobranchus ocellatus]|uniref:Uncharacterized protein n=1 Tax=Plakobranchus ocellatus TaxID=259542 RepID=A0AAV3ZQ10_9GAST|nr:hypothetical protein PoB_002453100 [Plakobranchus ocellatus]